MTSIGSIFGSKSRNTFIKQISESEFTSYENIEKEMREYMTNWKC